jgi:hypothetical protein
MSIIHLQRITSAIEKLFRDGIDLSDVQNRPISEQNEVFLSRGLAAYSLMTVADADASKASAAITDGYNDNGLDAVFFDRPNSMLYVVQAKWIKTGKGTIDQEHSKKFVGGFRDLVNLRLDRFNDRVRQREKELRDALHDSNVNFLLILSHTGMEKLSKHVQQDIDDLVNEMNTPDAVVSYEVFDQKRIYGAVAGYAQRHNINLEIMLQEWGFVKEPYRAYYGQVDVQSIAKWWGQHGRLLFTRNIRDFKGSTDVNDSLMRTLKNRPEHFWYFNNGITILCSKIAKKPLGGPSRESGVFECEGVNIVNGAQTVGIIGNLGRTLDEKTISPCVFVRIISLEDCPEGFDKEVTRATNTQNRIERRDFAALDPNQQRLASEFLLDGKFYVYKSGDEEPEQQRGCSIVDATIALACADPDVALAVLAKREVGRLWESIDAPPYTALFNDNTSAFVVWRAVEIMRTVEAMLKEFLETEPPRGDMVAIHGNRLILHCVFMNSQVRSFKNEQADFDQVKAFAAKATREVFGAMTRDVEEHYENSYLATLFKNLNKCRDIAGRLLNGVRSHGKGDPSIAKSVAADKTLFD